MKKLLGILVLGLLLSGCTTVRDEVTLWQMYKDDKAKYKAYASVYKWKEQGYLNYGKFYFRNYDSLDSLFSIMHKSKWCTKGCKIEYIGDEKVSKERQKEIAKKHLPPGLVKEMFSEPTKIVKKKKPKKKQTPDDNKVVAAASGSGFFVSNAGHIVTNHHVIDECKVLKVSYKGNLVEAKVLAIDKTNDLAIIQAKINPSKVYAVSNKDVALLEDIIVAGFPLGKNVSSAIKTHKGNVTALAGFGDNYSNFQTDATINQGNSGGPVMDLKGNIVGVAVALMSVEAGQNMFFAVKSSTLKTFASSNSLSFLPPNNRPMSNKDLGELITEGTVFLECWMTVAKIKQIIAQEENRKAFYSEYQ